MIVHQWVTLTVAAKLTGLSYQKAVEAAHAGRFGPVLKRMAALCVSTRGIELASGFLLTPDAVAIAEAAGKTEFVTMPEVSIGAVRRTVPVADP